MKKILITGATDGIGRLTALTLAQEGHHLLLHGRDQEKLARVSSEVTEAGGPQVETFLADLSELEQVCRLATEITEKHQHIDVLINNAGVLKTNEPITSSGLDIRFVVNTLAPYVLAKRLVALLQGGGRIVNLSSAAQAPVNVDALRGAVRLDHMGAYSQSKLAITMWTTSLAETLKPDVLAVSVNPGSLLASKMVKEGFGVAGKDLRIGADILCRASLSDEFSGAHGLYFDNDSGSFAALHPDAADKQKRDELMQVLDEIVGRLVSPKDEQ